jgi:tetratricopeptide (TPR) repeat protein
MSQEISKNTEQCRIDKLEAMLVQQPHDCFLLHALGLEYSKTGNDTKALDFFKQVLVVDENYVGTYYHLAKLYERLGQEIEAMNIYQQGVTIATRLKDMHARNELLMAMDELE